MTELKEKAKDTELWKEVFEYWVSNLWDYSLPQPELTDLLATIKTK